MIGMNEMAPASPAADEPDTLDPQQVEVLRRMGRAWREIRRGATAGEVRDVIDRTNRLREAAHPGFKRVVAARNLRTPRTEQGMAVLATGTVDEAVALALQPPERGRTVAAKE